MSLARLILDIAPVLRHSQHAQCALRRSIGPHLMTVRKTQMVGASSRSFSASVITRNKEADVRSRPRFAEHRKSTVESVVPPEEAIKVLFRPSRLEDCPVIYRYLLAHAEWEGCGELFEITEQDLINAGFGERPAFLCDVAEAHGRNGKTSVIGYGIYSINFCAWRGVTGTGENVFIHPDYRDKGIGAIFLHEIIKKMYELGCHVTIAHVDDREIGLKRWYASVGYEDETIKHNLHLYALSGKNLERYVNQEYDSDYYLTKAVSRDLNIESILTENGIHNSK